MASVKCVQGALQSQGQKITTPTQQNNRYRLPNADACLNVTSLLITLSVKKVSTYIGRMIAIDRTSIAMAVDKPSKKVFTMDGRKRKLTAAFIAIANTDKKIRSFEL